MIKFERMTMLALLMTGLLLGNNARASLLYDIMDLGIDGNSTPDWVLAKSKTTNAAGQSIGDLRRLDGHYVAAIINPGTGGYLYSLGTLPGYAMESHAKAINDAGQVTGYSGGVENPDHAFVTNPIPLVTTGYLGFKMTDLGVLPGGRYSAGIAINSFGLVAGYATTNWGLSHAFVTNVNGQMIDLGALGILGSSSASDINAEGQVVGYSTLNFENNSFSPRAFVTENGIMKDLNSLLISNTTDLILTSAQLINDAGQIICGGSFNNYQHSYLLTPVSAVVPLPAAFWLFASGLGLLTFNRRNNKIPA